MGRIHVVVVAVAAALVMAGAVLVGVVRARSTTSRLPERGVVVTVAEGLAAPADVVIDRRGIPHVRTATEADLWFVQGVLHARERFFQMELARRVAAGRLAELIGPQGLPSDRRMRMLRLAATATRQAAQLRFGERDALEAYAAGVNSVLTDSGRWVAPEIWFLSFDPEPWQVEDSLAVALLLELRLTWAMGEEMSRAVELARYGERRALDLWGWSPGEAREWIPPVDPPALPPRDDDAITAPVGGTGSNSWALAPSRTASGRPILANDPHVGVAMPATWYLIHLRSPGVHVTGASLPGIPGVAIGHTERVAWGMTMAMADDQDLYVVALDDSGQRERVDGGWQPLRTVAERILVRGRTEAERLKVRLSERGPVVREGATEALALAWSATMGPSPIGAFLEMNRAGSVGDLVAAWNGVPGPVVDLVAADVDGHVLHQVVGLLPDRGRGAGRLPAPAADPRWAWRGLQPLAANPRKADPEEGFVASANHDPFAEGDYPLRDRFPGEFAPPWRIRRIRTSLAARRDWDVPACLALQSDVVSERARALLALLGPTLADHGGRTARMLRGWDGTFAADSQEATRAARFVLELAEAVGGDEAYDAGLERTPFGAEELLRLLAGGLDEAWWDDVRTVERETREEILARVLASLDRRGGAARWGDVHRVRFDHPLAAVPLAGAVLGRMWSRGPYRVPGDGSTVDAHYWSVRRPFDVTAIPSLRFVAEVGEWDRTVMVLPVGQSGRPWSAHYDDQVGSWLAGTGETVPFSPEAVEAAAQARVRLIPGRSSRSLGPS